MIFAQCALIALDLFRQIADSLPFADNTPLAIDFRETRVFRAFPSEPLPGTAERLQLNCSHSV